jgi:hypothetical protein
MDRAAALLATLSRWTDLAAVAEKVARSSNHQVDRIDRVVIEITRNRRR